MREDFIFFLYIILLLASFLLYFGSEVDGVKRVLSPQLAPLVVSCGIDVIGFLIGLSAGFIIIFGRIDLSGAVLPNQKTYEPLHCKNDLKFSFNHTSPLYLESRGSSKESYLETYRVFTKNYKDFYGPERAVLANLKLNTTSSCFYPFIVDCMPRNLLALQASQLCPVLGELYVNACLPFPESCVALSKFKVVIAIHPSTLQSACPFIYDIWLSKFSEHYSLSYFLANRNELLATVQTTTRGITPCVNSELEFNCRRLYLYNKRNGISLGKQLPSLSIIPEE